MQRPEGRRPVCASLVERKNENLCDLQLRSNVHRHIKNAKRYHSNDEAEARLPGWKKNDRRRPQRNSAEEAGHGGSEWRYRGFWLNQWLASRRFIK
ncbi:hypothetical protein TNCV_3898121 [Trichonephila clavipes]|nr:hypothetical protein TNCV_3898121 [Trichonephila clavipes]